MRNIEQAPGSFEPRCPEVPPPPEIEILGEGKSDKEHKDEVMRGFYEERVKLSRILGALQEKYMKEKDSGKLASGREKDYQQKIDVLRKEIAQTAKLKARAQKQFEDYGKRMAA